jgi:hypothetical protein
MPHGGDQQVPVDIREFVHDNQGALSLVKREFIVHGKRVAEYAAFFLGAENVLDPPGCPHGLHAKCLFAGIDSVTPADCGRLSGQQIFTIITGRLAYTFNLIGLPRKLNLFFDP